MNPPQKTLAREISLAGRGLFSGTPSTVTFKPAPPGHGLVFVRTDLSAPVRIPALVQHITRRTHRSALRNGADSIETTEHVLAALYGMGVDNCEILLDGPEVPDVDGSSLPFVNILREAGLLEQSAETTVLRISQPVEVRDETGASLVASPPIRDEFQIFYELDYGPNTPVGKQLYSYTLASETFVEEIAPARTFCLRKEAELAQARGLHTHLKPGDMLVLDTDGPIATTLRFPNEPVRHKILDLIGDLCLLGCGLHGKITASRSGHTLNHALVRRLTRMLQAQRRFHLTLTEPIMDVRRIIRLMPHRYPMLLIDRVVEMDGDRRATGIKNVTMNEPFFQGHYPGTPVMPGVLIVEAMAQLAGLLLSRKLEHTGKLPMLLSLDKVKLRRPVVPGDQLVLQAENIRVKARTGHVKTQAFVGEQLAAEAYIKFMMVDNDLSGTQ